MDEIALCTELLAEGEVIMRNSVRLLILLVCLIQLATVVSAAAPIPATPQSTVALSPEQESAEVDPADQDCSDLASAETAWDESVPELPVTESPLSTEPAPEEPVPEEPAPEEPAPEEPDPEEPAPEEPEPEEPEIPVSEMSDEQIIQKYSIKNNWARAGLIFAVRNGILAGKGNNKLCPKDNTTHAELATMLIGILRTEKRASLSRFTDVKAKKWYAVPMSKAVSLGIFPIADPNAATLTPNVRITREEAYVAIARVFGIHGNGRQSIYRFNDWREVSDWAADDISAMIDAGALSGSNGNIMPKKELTRQELAVILASLLTKVGDSLEADSVTGNFALAADTIPSGTTVKGDLLLSTDATELTLENLKVTGKLIMQGNDMLTLRLVNCKIGELVLCRSTKLYSDTTVSKVSNHALVRLCCNAKTVSVYDRLVIPTGQSVETVNAMYDSAITVAGTVKHMQIVGDSVYINGNGTIETLHQHGVWLANYCKTNKVVGTVRNSIETATATRIDGSVPSISSPSATLKLKLQNMPDGWLEGELLWCINGKNVNRGSRSIFQQGSTISQAYNFSDYLDGTRSSVPLTVYLIAPNGYKRQLYTGDVKLDASLSELAKQIRTQNVQATLTQNVTIYSNMNLTGAIKSCSSGTQVTLLQSRQSSYTKIRTPDGTEGWVKYSAVRVISANYYTTTDYSTAVKEYYVNHVRNCSSKTGYLIWVSLYTQRINVFKGSKGNWKLVLSGPIASGRNECPTPVEVTSIKYKTAQWSYPNYYCHHVSVFDEARGFHSRPTAYSGGIYNAAIGYPASAGCVRLMDSDCTFIYNNCPVGTAVYIY